MDKDNISGFSSEPTKQNYDVEVYNKGALIETISVKAIDAPTASSQAFDQFFADIKVKVKRNYG